VEKTSEAACIGQESGGKGGIYRLQQKGGGGNPGEGRSLEKMRAYYGQAKRRKQRRLPNQFLKGHKTTIAKNLGVNERKKKVKTKGKPDAHKGGQFQLGSLRADSQ